MSGNVREHDREPERRMDTAMFERHRVSGLKLSPPARELYPLKKPHEHPSIGVLLCRDKEDEVVEYALSRHLSPALIAEYQLQLPDKKMLQAKLREICVNAEAHDER